MPSISRLRSKPWVAIGAGLIGMFLAIQFIRPELATPPVTGNIRVPAQVEHILRTSCYNCHSNETRLPWFDQIVPAYWMAVADVKRGRQGVNFSEFDKVSEAQQRGILFDSVTQIQFGVMPLKRYELVHPESRVTPEQLAVLKQYLSASSGSHAPATSQEEAAATEQYETWRRSPASPGEVRPSPNGLAFIPEYKNWRAISSTARFDNNTLRAVLANDVAVAAVHKQQINPWPDGTEFAKVAWTQLDNGSGHVRPGKFLQVEFMIKDGKKYASTKGWGWARWKGMDLQPYGSSADFSAECVGCHTPMQDRDFVFTMPMPLQAIGDLPLQPLEWNVITTSIDHRDGTMATLYGNDAAVLHARGGSEFTYPPGSVLSLVTWMQRDDEHWFGARIPGDVRTVEFVTVGSVSGQPPAVSYQEYRGSPLRNIPARPETLDSRVNYVLSQRASVMP